jgi:hypothetical protein
MPYKSRAGKGIFGAEQNTTIQLFLAIQSARRFFLSRLVFRDIFFIKLSQCRCIRLLSELGKEYNYIRFDDLPISVVIDIFEYD